MSAERAAPSWKARVLTLYPRMFPGPLGHSLAGKGLAKGLLETVLKGATTPFLLATIREDNRTSMNLFKLYGFVPSGSFKKGQHTGWLLTRSTQSEVNKGTQHA